MWLWYESTNGSWSQLANSSLYSMNAGSQLHLIAHISVPNNLYLVREWTA